MSGGLEIRLTKIKIRVDKAAATAVGKEEGVRRVAEWMRKVQAQAIIDCPVDTGNLRAHHRIKIKELSTKIKGTVYNDAKYAAAVHDGAKAHVIRGRKMRRPTKKRRYRGPKTLRFVVGGVVVFRREVHHPGNKGRPWLVNAAKKVSKDEGFRWTDSATAADDT